MFNINNKNPGLPLEMKYHFEKTPFGLIPCQSNKEERTLFFNYIKEKENGIFVEIGIFGGINLFGNYEIAKNKKWQIIGIDPHDKIQIFNGIDNCDINNNITDKRYSLFKEFRLKIEKIILKNSIKNIKYINDTSWNAYKIFKNNSIDILHIDGDHSYDGVIKDLNLFINKMKNNSKIILDDWNWNCIKQAFNDFNKEYNFSHNEIFNGEKLVVNIIF
jgi:hypothetical protein